MAKLNLDFYRGEDNYSDGTIEDDILAMVKSHEVDDEKIIKSGSYPIIYHLSHLRENILNWYPFDSEASILEIGAGCGALTGLLCNRLKKVVSVELTKRRATINFERNQNKENLEIYVGNFNNMTFDTKFDYVVLNGVFEYAISFTEGDNPYVNFINYIKSFLKPDGKILIAIENRLGLKYFAGTREDHTGRFFSGLNQYDDTEFVRTFTKNELIGILKECGLEQYKFYYPYPDYKFPSEIFTDNTINTEKFGKQYYTFDAERLNLFNENMVSHTLADEKLAEYFSNSFLVEVRMHEDIEKTEILYAKLSNDRKREYRIATILQNDNGKLIAIKKALTREAEQHIENLYYSGVCQIHSNIENIKGKYEKNQIIYPLLENRTMSQEINLYIKEKKPENIINLLQKFYKYMFSNTTQTSDYSTIKFKEVFGKEYISMELNCTKPANIDLICDNIFMDKEKFIIIDTEWVFDFLIPSEFIVWRFIHDLYENYSELNMILDKNELLNLFGIDSSMILIFIKWINYFADNYVGNDKMKNNVRKMSYNVDLDNIIKEYQNANKLNSNLYYDIGNGFSESNRISSTVELKKNNFEIFYDLSILKGKVHGLRWDPIEYQPCRCRLTKVEIDQGGVLIPINAYSSIDGVDIFLNKDSIYLAKEISPKTKYMKITGNFKNIDFKEYMSLCEDEISKMQQHETSLATDFNKKLEQCNKLTEQLENETKKYEETAKQLYEKTEKHKETAKQLHEKTEKHEETAKQLNKKKVEYQEISEKYQETSEKYKDVCNELSEIYNSKLGKVFLRSRKRKSCLRRE